MGGGASRVDWVEFGERFAGVMPRRAANGHLRRACPNLFQADLRQLRR